MSAPQPTSTSTNDEPVTSKEDAPAATSSTPAAPSGNDTSASASSATVAPAATPIAPSTTAPTATVAQDTTPTEATTRAAPTYTPAEENPSSTVPAAASNSTATTKTSQHPTTAAVTATAPRVSPFTSNNNSRSTSPSASSAVTAAAASTASSSSSAAAFRPLNVRDALAYLDRVKQQFSSEYAVYDQFLTIMKEFKTQAIDTPGVIDRVSTLFRGHPSLIQGFNTFLPPGYRIECSVSGSGNDAGGASNTITVTTPQGTTTRTQDVAGLEAREFVNSGGSATPKASASTSGKSTAATLNAASEAVSGGASASTSTSAKPAATNNASASSTAAGSARIISPPAPIPPYGGGKATKVSNAGASTSTNNSFAGWQNPQQPAASAAKPPRAHNGGSNSSNRQSKREDDDASGKGKGGDASGDTQMASTSTSAPAPAAPVASGSATPAQQPQLEFNHAINYVNKIKNRFTKDPDTYKTFLEILQTYQKEMKPIQEVYTQVTALFHTAPDLLDEFKAFLPDTSENAAAAGAGVPAPVAASVAGAKKAKDSASRNGGNSGNNSSSNRDDARAGGISGKKAGAFEEKKKRAAPGQGEKSKAKRTKTHHVDSPPVLPNLNATPTQTKADRQSSSAANATPQPPLNSEPPPGPAMYHPQPYGAPPSGFPGAVRSRSAYDAYLAGHRSPQLVQAEEFSFFDRVKKHIDDRTSYTDFLKLLNLFTQEIIDIKTLLEKALIFIGDSDELFAQFKDLVGWNPVKDGRIEGEDWVIDNEPAWKRPPVDLREALEYGPSYRRLPESEIDLACSGRGPLEWSVLNDEWVAWATSQSEGSNAHRKNPYEEAFYYAEQERHWYSFHIESNLRTIAHFEPIAARIAKMTNEERNAFRLDGLGGTAPSVYERIIKKIYGKDHCWEILQAICDSPATTIPVVLSRLKQKDEEWKRAEKEWNRVWREVDVKNYYRALDHQGILFKALDKKASMTSKALTNEIEALRKDKSQKRFNLDDHPEPLRPSHQFELGFSDRDVLFDVLKLTLSYLDRDQSGYSGPERVRLEAFIRLFIPLLFDVSQSEMDANLAPQDESNDGPDEDDAGSEAEGGEDGDKEASSSSSSNKRNGANKKGGAADLRKRLLKHVATSSSRHHGRNGGSRANSPNGIEDSFGALSAGILGEQKWIQLTSESEADMAAEAPSTPRRYNFFANACFYALLRMLHTVYHRLLTFKQLTIELSKREKLQRLNPLAVELGLAQPMPVIDDGINPADQYYDHLLDLAEKMFDGDIDQATYEEQLRYMAGVKAYPLYTLDKLIAGVIKHIHTGNSDSKCQDLTALLEKDRAGACVTPRQMIAYRNEAEAIIGSDDSLYRLEWIPDAQALTIQLLGREDLSLDDSIAPLPEQIHKSWIASYPLTSATEGVGAKVKGPLLKRNRMLSAAEDPQEFDISPGLEAKLVGDNYQLKFVAGTEDYLYRKRPPVAPEPEISPSDTPAPNAGEKEKPTEEGEEVEVNGDAAEAVEEVVPIQRRRRERFEKWLKERFDAEAENGAAMQVE